MNHRLSSLLAFALFLTFCAPHPAQIAPVAPTKKPISTLTHPTTTPQPTATSRPTASPTPESNRTASFTSIENTVDARNSEADDYLPASLGQRLPVGGQARTGEDGRARLDLAPDNTIIRVVPSTFFTLPELKETKDGPYTLLELSIGQIYIILSGGELQVRTPSGVAAVRGSMLGVYYNPQTNAMLATCLEGHCSLSTEDRVLELVAGQAADILNGILCLEPRLITERELSDWFENAPELENFLDILPSLRDRIDILPELPRRRP